MKENWVYRRGDLYLANLGVPVGSKQGGVRPVVVLQNDVGNYYAPTITIAPLTSKIEKKRKQPTHFFLRKAKGLAKPSMVLAEQIDTCDKVCVIRYLGRVSKGQMRGIDEAVRIQLGYYIPEQAEKKRQGKSDTPEFRQRLHQEIIDETYPKLHELLRPLSDNDIDKAIQDWNGKIESKHAVVRYMEKHGREKDTAAWLAHEFDGGDGKTPFSVRPESPEGTVMPWPKVQRRIAQLIKEDRFYTEAEQERFDNIDPIAIREALAERGIVNGELVDEEKLDNDPFIQRVMADVEAISRESVQADEPEQPSPHNSRVLVSDEEYAAARGTLRERTSYDPAVPPYHVGDTVYLDDRPHQITELRDDTVQLLPTGMSYPIYRAESRERFEQLYYVRGVFRLETGIYAPVERPDDPPGKPRHRPARKPHPYRQCTGSDAAAFGSREKPAGQPLPTAGRSQRGNRKAVSL